jgi:hypothetical protein
MGDIGDGGAEQRTVFGASSRIKTNDPSIKVHVQIACLGFANGIGAARLDKLAKKSILGKCFQLIWMTKNH